MNSLRTLLLVVTIMFTSIFGAGCEDEDPKREDDPAPVAGEVVAGEDAAGEVVAGESAGEEQQEGGTAQSGTESLAGEVEAGTEEVSGEVAGEQTLPVEAGEDLPVEPQEADMGVEEPESESIPG